MPPQKSPDVVHHRQASDVAPRSSSIRSKSSLVGRTSALADLESRLAAGVRWLTLVGPGGVGKTRLALEFAHTAGWRRSSWAIVCDLSATRSQAEFCAAVARALDLQVDEGDGEPFALARRIGGLLARRGPSVVVLDNLEQLGPDAAIVVDCFHAAAPDSVFVVTSRQPLGSLAEVVVPVEPLALPSASTPGDFSMFDSDAVELFLTRAEARVHGTFSFALDGPLIAEIVRRLEGIPLAIELAAARLDVMPLPALGELLSERFVALRDPIAETERHGTLWRTIDWSWQLLPPWQQVALAQLSMFEGSFSVRDAEVVIALAESPDAPTVLDALHALVRQNLVRVEPANVDAPARFFLFAMIREFAQRQLSDEDVGAVRARHSALYLERARAVAEAIDVSGDTALVSELERDEPELVGILRDALAVKPATATSARAAMSAMIALDPLFMLRRCSRDHLALLDATMAALRRANEKLAAIEEARLELARTTRLKQLGRYRDALVIAAHARRLAHDAGAHRIEALLLLEEARCSVACSEHAKAWEAADDAVRLTRSNGDPRTEGLARIVRAVASVDRGRYGDAVVDAEAALALLRANGRTRDEAAAHQCLGIVFYEQGNRTAARGHLEWSYAFYERFGDPRHAAVARGYLAGLAHEAEDFETAREGYESARAAFAELVEPRLEAIYSGYVGIVDTHAGHLETGTLAIESSLARLDALGDKMYAHVMMGALAGAHALRNDRSSAEALLARMERATSESDANGRMLLELYRAVLETTSGDVIAAKSTHGRLAREPLEHIRLALPLLRRAVQTAEQRARTWSFRCDGTSFRGPDGTRVSLATRIPLTLALRALVAHRLSGSTEPMLKSDLIAATWPDEPRLSRIPASNRLKVAMNTLRKFGLQSILVFRQGGYFLDPDVPIQIEDGAMDEETAS
jgi:predicted ATPase